MRRSEVRHLGPARFRFLARRHRAVAAAALASVGRAELAGFWIYVDADLLDPQVMPPSIRPNRVDLGFDELAALLAPLVDHPRALGMQITIYDPSLDPDRSCATRLAVLFESLLGKKSKGGR